MTQYIQRKTRMKIFCADTQDRGPSQYNDAMVQMLELTLKNVLLPSYIDDENPLQGKTVFILKQGSDVYQRGGRRYLVSKCYK